MQRTNFEYGSPPYLTIHHIYIYIYIFVQIHGFVQYSVCCLETRVTLAVNGTVGSRAENITKYRIL